MSKTRTDVISGSERLVPAIARWVPALLSEEWVTVRSKGGCGYSVLGVMGGGSEDGDGGDVVVSCCCWVHVADTRRFLISAMRMDSSSAAMYL